MKIMTAQQAADFCRDNKVKPDSWSCGYALEAYLELDHNIKLENENAWVELENILYYN